MKVKYEPKGREGKTTADGWMILYDNGTSVEAISPTAMKANNKTLTLGENDTTIKWDELTETSGAFREADLDEDSSLDSVEKAIYSYNHAIDTINNYCKTLPGLPANSGVRSVGAKTDPRPNLNVENVYNGMPAYWPEQSKQYNGKGKKTDAEYIEDLIRINYWELTNNGKIGIEEAYWIASRVVIESRGYSSDDIVTVEFGVRTMLKSTADTNYCCYLWHVDGDWYHGAARTGGYSDSCTHSHAVRPIITIDNP